MKDKYLFITAIVDCGSLHWEYQVEGLKEARVNHDEDVEDWSDDDIKDLTIRMLDVPADQQHLISVEYA